MWNGAFPHPFVRRNYIFHCLREKMMTSVNHIFPWAVEISFLTTKGCWNAIPVRNEDISLCNFSINPLKNHCGNKWGISTEFSVKKWYFHCSRQKIIYDVRGYAICKLNKTTNIWISQHSQFQIDGPFCFL